MRGVVLTLLLGLLTAVAGCADGGVVDNDRFEGVVLVYFWGEG